MPSPSTVGLRAKLGVETDSQQVKKKTNSLKDKLDEATNAEMDLETGSLKGDIKKSIQDATRESKFVPDVDMGERPGVPGFGDKEKRDLGNQMEALGQNMPDTIGGPTAQMAGEGSGGGGRGLLAGMAGAGGKFLKVGLAGAVGLGILGAVTKFSDAAPRMNKVLSQLFRSVQLFARPFLDYLAKFLQGPINALLQMGANFNTLYQEKGLKVALAQTIGNAAEGTGEFVMNNPRQALLGAGGAITAGSLLGYVFGKGFPIGVSGLLSRLLPSAITGSAIVGAISWPMIGAGLITGALSWGAFNSGNLIEAMGWGTLTGGLLAAAIPFGTVTGGLIVGAIAWPTIKAGQILAEIAGGGTPDNPFYEAGKNFGNNPFGDAIETAVTSEWNPFYTAGKMAGNFGSGRGGPPRRGPGPNDSRKGPRSGDGRGGKRGDKPDNPRGMASGGVVTSATKAVVGEGTEPEAVLPLSKLETMLNTAAGQGRMSSDGSDREVVNRLDTLVDEMQTLNRELKKLDADVELKTDEKTLAEETRKGDNRFHNRRVVSR